MARYRKFTQEYREEAVKLVIETSRSIAEVARELGINEGMRRLRAEQQQPGDDLLGAVVVQVEDARPLPDGAGPGCCESAGSATWP